MSPVRLTRAQIREVDRRAIEVYGIPSLVLMENAGRGCVDLLCSAGIEGPVTVCCGRGNNAGDGFVMIRHLLLRGHETRVLLLGDPESLRGDAKANFEILLRCEVPFERLEAWNEATARRSLAGSDWIVDALLGTGAMGEPRAPLDRLIPLVNEWPARRLAVDVPSGLDCDTGQPARHTFRADHTCTFVAAKAGFASPAARDYLGQVHVLDIGAPPRIVEEVLSHGAADGHDAGTRA